MGSIVVLVWIYFIKYKILKFYAIFVPVKLYVYFMAIHILILGLVPCSDMHTEYKDISKKNEFTQNHNHEEDKDDECSPFCICACCGNSISILNFEPLNISKLLNFFINQKVAFGKFSFICSFFGNIWQPPKLIA